ncbi:MAG: hypothetical protein ACJAZ8_001651 [Planctomycetota bacterium]|jgi:hypothetical protein
MTLVPGNLAKNAITRLAAWHKDARQNSGSLSGDQIKELEDIVDDLVRLGLGNSKYAHEARELLLDTAAFGLQNTQGKQSDSSIRAVAQANISRRLRPGHGKELLDWLTDEVLPLPDLYTPLQRTVAVRALGQHCLDYEPSPHLLLALVQAGRAKDAMVRGAAMTAIKGRPEEFLTGFFLSALERGNVGPEVLAEHLRLRLAAGGELLEAGQTAKQYITDPGRARRILDYIAPRLFHEDWRESSRSLAVIPLLEPSMAVPMLIEGLEYWSRITAEGTGSRRVVHELRQALGVVAGRDLGLNPEIWAKWWKLSQDPSTVLSPAPKQQSVSSTFFGLRPVSDRLLFLIDRSGSMDKRFGAANSRFDEAVERLIYTLHDLGPKTQFRVVLFSDDTRTFSSELTFATDRQLDKLETWATNVGTAGGTDLQGGVNGSFSGLRSGKLAPTEIDVDTVIVLCDGETGNPDWVDPWLSKFNHDARLKFHCVNLGGRPGGGLEALATGSGGRFVLSNQ